MNVPSAFALQIVCLYLPHAEPACEVDGVGKSVGSSELAGTHWEFGTSRLSLLERHALAELYVRTPGTLASWLAWGTACLSCLSSLVWGSRRREEVKALSSGWSFESNGSPGLVRLKRLLFCFFGTVLGSLFQVLTCLGLVLDGKGLSGMSDI